MTVIQFRRLTVWPGVATRGADRRDSQFRASYQQTLDLLDEEIVGKLRGTDIELQGFMAANNVYKNGWPLEKATALNPGVIVTFRTKRLGEQVYAADQYFSWQDNLRGIALTLVALRAVERYGAVREHQQYRGFSRDLIAHAAPVVPQSKILAAEVLIDLSGETRQDAVQVAADPDRRESLYRTAVKRVHPDAFPLGSAELMRRLQTAIEVLRRP